MEPIEWIALASAVIGAAGAGVSAQSSMAAGKAQRRDASARAAAMRREAERKDEAARLAAAQGDRRVQERALDQRRLSSNLTARFAAAGFDTVGSADYNYINREIAARSSYAGRLDAWDAAMQSRAYTIEANELRAGATNSQNSGAAAQSVAQNKAWASGISGLSSFATKFGGMTYDNDWFSGGGGGTNFQPSMGAGVRRGQIY